jgi:RecQ family ATP-dependent DNA helicase
MSNEVTPDSREAAVGSAQMEAYFAGMAKLPYVMNRLGIPSLRPGQDRSVRTAMLGLDNITILPTATGKSLCFIAPTLCMDWKTIVIYPLVALMRDQVQSMQRKGLPAATISSHESDAHNASVLRDWAAGDLQFMLVSPERFNNEAWASVVEQYPPDFVAMDESHTFGDWADTFRPGYKFAGNFIQRARPKVVAAYSATLTLESEEELRAGLGLQNAALVYHYPRRKNLLLSSLFLDDIRDAPPWLVRNCDGATIVYASTRKRTEEYASMIQRYTDRPIFYYHGGMNQKERKTQQDGFMKLTDSIIVATNAFGMGIDKDNIRNVVHFDIPGRLVALAQECVHPDSMISTALGVKVASEVVSGEKMLDYHFEAGGYAPAMTTQTMENQTEKLMQLHTTLGSTLRVSPNHPVFVRTEGGVVEVPAADVQVGDQLLAQAHLPPANPTPVDVVALLADYPEPVFVKVNPNLVDRLREKLSPVEVSKYFRLSRSYDYNAYKGKKHGRLAYWLEACAAVGVSPSELRDNITHFKTRSSRSITLPPTLTADLGWWFGIVATNGNVSRVEAGSSKGYGSWRVRLGSTNVAIADKFAEIAERLGVKARRYIRQPDGCSLAKQAANVVECSHPILAHLCNKAGIPAGRKSHSVSVPSWLRSADAPLRAGFIAGVIDGDGCLAKDNYQMCIHSAAWNFLSGVCMLLRGFGIPATCYAEDYTRKADVMTTREDHGYSLRVSSTEHYEHLRDVVARYSCKSWQPVGPPNAGQDMTAQRRCRRPTIIPPGGEWLQDEILEKSEVAYVGRVLNWRVEPGNQLVVDGILTHNCGRAGRDGADSNCVIIPTREGVKSQRHFIRCGNPTQEDVSRFLKAAMAMREGPGGPVMAKRDEIAAKAGIDPFLVQAIMAFCHGEGVVVDDKSAARKTRVRLLSGVPTMTPKERETRDALIDVSYEEDDWRHFDIDALAEQLGLEPTLVMSRLRRMHAGGKLEWITASTKRPLQIVKTPSQIPKAAFDRLNEKARKAEEELQRVLGYCDAPDDEKHDYLEKHLNR